MIQNAHSDADDLPAPGADPRGTIFLSLPPETRRGITGAVQRAFSLYQDATIASFTALRKDIAGRKLYVMFEDSLGCDPKSDHLMPKDVSPLFSPFLIKAEEGLLTVCKSGVGPQIEEALLEQLGKQYEEVRDLESRVSALTRVLTSADELLRGSDATIESLIAEKQGARTRLLTEIQQLREQLYQRRAAGERYKPDALAGSSSGADADLDAPIPSSVKRELSEKDAEIRRLKAKDRVSQDSVAAAQKEIGQLQREVINWRQTAAENGEMLEATQAERDLLRSQTDELNSMLQGLQDQQRGSALQNEEARKAAEETIFDLRADLEAARAEAIEYRGKAKELEEALHTAKESRETSDAYLLQESARYRQQYEQLRDAHKSLEARAEKAERAAEIAALGESSELQELRHSNSSLQAELEEKRTALEKLRTHYSVQKQKLDLAQKKLKSLMKTSEDRSFFDSLNSLDRSSGQEESEENEENERSDGDEPERQPELFPAGSLTTDQLCTAANNYARIAMRLLPQYTFSQTTTLKQVEAFLDSLFIGAEVQTDESSLEVQLGELEPSSCISQTVSQSYLATPSPWGLSGTQKPRPSEGVQDATLTASLAASLMASLEGGQAFVLDDPVLSAAANDEEVKKAAEQTAASFTTLLDTVDTTLAAHSPASPVEGSQALSCFIATHALREELQPAGVDLSVVLRHDFDTASLEDLSIPYRERVLQLAARAAKESVEAKKDAEIQVLSCGCAANRPDGPKTFSKVSRVHNPGRVAAEAANSVIASRLPRETFRVDPNSAKTQEDVCDRLWRQGELLRKKREEERRKMLQTQAARFSRSMSHLNGGDSRYLVRAVASKPGMTELLVIRGEDMSHFSIDMNLKDSRRSMAVTSSGALPALSKAREGREAREAREDIRVMIRRSLAMERRLAASLPVGDRLGPDLGVAGRALDSMPSERPGADESTQRPVSQGLTTVQLELRGTSNTPVAQEAQEASDVLGPPASAKERGFGSSLVSHESVAPTHSSGTPVVHPDFSVPVTFPRSGGSRAKALRNAELQKALLSSPKSAGESAGEAETTASKEGEETPLQIFPPLRKIEPSRGVLGMSDTAAGEPQELRFTDEGDQAGEAEAGQFSVASRPREIVRDNMADTERIPGALDDTVEGGVSGHGITLEETEHVETAGPADSYALRAVGVPLGDLTPEDLGAGEKGEDAAPLEQGIQSAQMLGRLTSTEVASSKAAQDAIPLAGIQATLTAGELRGDRPQGGRPLSSSAPPAHSQFVSSISGYNESLPRFGFIDMSSSLRIVDWGPEAGEKATPRSSSVRGQGKTDQQVPALPMLSGTARAGKEHLATSAPAADTVVSSMLAAGLDPTSQIQLNLAGKRHDHSRAGYQSYLASASAAMMSPAEETPLEYIRLGDSGGRLPKTRERQAPRAASRSARSGQQGQKTATRGDLSGTGTANALDAARSRSRGAQRPGGAMSSDDIQRALLERSASRGGQGLRAQTGQRASEARVVRQSLNSGNIGGDDTPIGSASRENGPEPGTDEGVESHAYVVSTLDPDAYNP